jgi:hypothetical protein
MRSVVTLDAGAAMPDTAQKTICDNCRNDLCHYCSAELVDPDNDWMIFDTPIGSYEIVVCDAHYADRPEAKLSALGAVELSMSHPVVHG